MAVTATPVKKDTGKSPGNTTLVSSQERQAVQLRKVGSLLSGHGFLMSRNNSAIMLTAASKNSLVLMKPSLNGNIQNKCEECGKQEEKQEIGNKQYLQLKQNGEDKELMVQATMEQQRQAEIHQQAPDTSSGRLMLMPEQEEAPLQMKTSAGFAMPAMRPVKNIPEIQLKCATCEAEGMQNVQRKQATFEQDEKESHEAIVQTRVEIGRPDDKYEREADAVADKVMRMPEKGNPELTEKISPAIPMLRLKREPDSSMDSSNEEEEPEEMSRKEAISYVQKLSSDDSEDQSTSHEKVVRRKHKIMRSSGGKMYASPGISRLLSSTKGSGFALPQNLQSDLGNKMGVDLSTVRIHTDANAVQLSKDLGAQAFTHGNHIYFNQGKYNPDTSSGKHLLVHELAHTVQQTGETVRFRQTPEVEKPFEDRKDTVVSQDASGVIRRSVDSVASSLWNATGGRVVDGARAIGRGAMELAGNVMDWGRDRLMAFVRRISPEFGRLIEEGGIIHAIRETVASGFRSLFSTIMGGLRNIGGINALFSLFSRAIGWFSTVTGQLARGDCSAIFSAAGRFSDFVEGIFTPAIQGLRRVASVVSGVFSSIWDRTGAPMLEFLQRVGGTVWQGLTRFAGMVGNVIGRVKDALGAAWTRVKSWFSLPEVSGSGESGGILNWITSRASGVWTWARNIIQPVMGPLRVVGTILVLLSPVGPAIALYRAWPYLRNAFQWIRAQWGRGTDAIVRARVYISNTLIPQILRAVNAVGGALQEGAQWIGGLVSRIGSGISQAIQALGGHAFLAPLRTAVSFVGNVFNTIAQWGRSGLNTVVTGATRMFHAIRSFCERIWPPLQRIIALVVNPFGISGFLLGNLWLLLPTCLKGPIINFIINILLRVVRVLPFNPMFGPLFPFVKAGIVGFLTRVQEFSTERKVKVANKIATIISGGSVSFAFGFLRGLATGVWEGIIAPFNAIRELFHLPERIRSLVGFIREVFPEFIEQAREMFSTLGERITSGYETVVNTARDLLSNPRRILDMISSAIQAGLSAMSNLGSTFANHMMRLFEGPDATLGQQLGNLAGNYLVQAVLSFFTAGGASAATAISRVAQVLARIAGNVMNVVRRVLSYFPQFMNFIRRIQGMFSRARSAAGNFMDRIVRFFQRIFERLREMANGVRRRIEEAVDRVGERFGRRRREGDGHLDLGESQERKRIRLNIAAASIRPGLEVLLSRGVSRVRLVAQLLYWRVRHRLSRLEILGSRTNFSIRATINPFLDIAHGFEMDPTELLNYIRNVANEVIQISNQRARPITSAPGATPAQTVHTVPPEAPLPSVIQHIGQLPSRQQGASDILSFPGMSRDDGSVSPEARVRIEHQRGRGRTLLRRMAEVVRGAMSRWVSRRGSVDYFSRQPSASSIASLLDEAFSSQEDRRRAVAALQTWVVRREVPVGMEEHLPVLSYLATLMVGKEGSRSPAAVVTAPLALDLAGQPEATFQQSLATFPMSSPHTSQQVPGPPSTSGQRRMVSVGPTVEADDLNRYLRGGQRLDFSRPHSQEEMARIHAMAQAEIELIKAWVRAMDLNFNNHASQEAKENYLKRQIRRRIFNFYGLQDPRPIIL